MDFFSIIAALAMPLLVTITTSISKKYSVVNMKGHRVLILRAIVAVLSLIGAGISAYLVGDIVDVGTMEVALLAVYNAVVATWLYYADKRLSADRMG